VFFILKKMTARVADLATKDSIAIGDIGSAIPNQIMIDANSF
jgi:D-ribose pyranose/furanose isomerase RbsD